MFLIVLVIALSVVDAAAFLSLCQCESHTLCSADGIRACVLGSGHSRVSLNDAIREVSFWTFNPITKQSFHSSELIDIL